MNIVSKPIHATAHLWTGRDLAGLKDFIGVATAMIPSGDERDGKPIAVAFVASEHIGFQIARPGDYVVRESNGTIRVYDEPSFNAVYAEAS